LGRDPLNERPDDEIIRLLNRADEEVDVVLDRVTRRLRSGRVGVFSAEKTYYGSAPTLFRSTLLENCLLGFVWVAALIIFEAVKGWELSFTTAGVFLLLFALFLFTVTFVYRVPIRRMEEDLNDQENEISSRSLKTEHTQH
jgi:hypothetical protein